MRAASADLPETGDRAVVHGTSVSFERRALLIIGPSGSGKSGLALELMAHGAGLIADDRTLLIAAPDGPPRAAAPEAIRGRIEARGLGILAATPAPPAPLAAILDLGQRETERLPPHRTCRVLGHEIQLLHNGDTSHFSAAILQYLRGGWG